MLPEIKPVEGGHAGDLRNAELPAAAARWSPGRSTTSSWSPVRWSPSSCSPSSGWVPSRSSSSRLRPPRTAGRGADAGRHQHRGDQRRRSQSGRLAASSSPRPRSSPPISARARRASSSPTTRSFPIRRSPKSCPDARRRGARAPQGAAARPGSPKASRPEARVRVTQLVFGPYSPVPRRLSRHGPRPDELRGIADQVRDVMRANPEHAPGQPGLGRARRRRALRARSGPPAADRPVAGRRRPAVAIPADGRDGHRRSARISGRSMWSRAAPAPSASILRGSPTSP